MPLHLSIVHRQVSVSQVKLWLKFLHCGVLQISANRQKQNPQIKRSEYCSWAIGAILGFIYTDPDIYSNGLSWKQKTSFIVKSRRIFLFRIPASPIDRHCKGKGRIQDGIVHQEEATFEMPSKCIIPLYRLTKLLPWQAEAWWFSSLENHTNRDKGNKGVQVLHKLKDNEVLSHHLEYELRTSSSQELHSCTPVSKGLNKEHKKRYVSYHPHMMWTQTHCQLACTLTAVDTTIPTSREDVIQFVLVKHSQKILEKTQIRGLWLTGNRWEQELFLHLVWRKVLKNQLIVSTNLAAVEKKKNKLILSFYFFSYAFLLQFSPLPLSNLIYVSHEWLID